MTLPNDYRERVYAGWLGKCIGVRFGGPVESWTYQDIANHLGEVTDYLPLPPGTVFKPDDDTAFPMVLIRVLEDIGPSVTTEQMGETVLNYLGDQRGTFWWGGYGISTEHTAYVNLANGIPAPRSGSIAQNGKALAEQIGGQIFSDIWGLVAPNNPELAAEYAAKASSVTHDGEGVYGGRFIAALVSAAFSERDPANLIQMGLQVVPKASEFARVTCGVRDFHCDHPNDWRECYQFIFKNFGYDKYPGAVHIIPNAGIVAMALLYGNGDLVRTVAIATNAGWDTDCNAGNVGAIIGVANGLAGIDPHLRAPMNDVLVAASLTGARNLWNIPTCADLFYDLGLQIAGQQRKPRPRFHFDYPGSTHGFVGVTERADMINVAHGGESALRVTIRGMNKKGEARAFVKAYLHANELSANSYGASFSPPIYPGQTLTARVIVPTDAKQDLMAAPFVWDDNHRVKHQGLDVELIPGQTQDLRFAIPRMDNALFSQFGVVFKTRGEPFNGHVLLDAVDWSGQPDYGNDFSLERNEYGAISQWTYLRGYWRLEDGAYHGSGAGISESYTGDHTWRDLSLTVDLVPILGDSHNINLRVEGARRSYAIGLAANQRVVIYKNAGGYRAVEEAKFAWKKGERYRIHAHAVGATIAVSVNDQQLLTWTDKEKPYLNGQIGLSNFASHTRYDWFEVKGKE